MVNEYISGQPQILLLDSDSARATHWCDQLTTYGWHVFPVGSDGQAVQAVESNRIDLALLQISPAQAAEVDLPGRLQRSSHGAYLPVIVITDQPTTDTEADRCKCLEVGTDEILPESVSQGELWARIKALLRIKNLQDQLNDSRRSLQEALRREHELLVELQADNDRLAKQVVTDPLTRLYNVRYFERFLDDELKIASRYNHSLSMLMLDLDHFKMVNDRHGHSAGDFVLKELSVILRQSVRESDVVARTGGEEFAVILPRADAEQAEQFAQRIRQTLAEHVFIIGTATIRITCSIGLACYGSDTDVTSPEHLMYFADQALLKAKQSGRNCVVHWSNVDNAVKNRLRVHINEVLAAKQQPTKQRRTLTIGK